MKKLLLLSALLIFACSSDDSSDTNDDNDNNNELLNCDGNPVPTIVYGTQEWTVENACHTTYRDGTPIPQVTDYTEWNYLTIGAWCYYENDPTKPRLYNWYAIMGIHDTDPNTPNKDFTPEGWHVPSHGEWTTLRNYLIINGYNYDFTSIGNKISKSMASSSGWNGSSITGTPGNNQSLNNSSEFNAVPIGFRGSAGDYFQESTVTAFWSSTETNTLRAWGRSLEHDSNNLIDVEGIKVEGYSIRLVKD